MDVTRSSEVKDLSDESRRKRLLDEEAKKLAEEARRIKEEKRALAEEAERIRKEGQAFIRKGTPKPDPEVSTESQSTSHNAYGAVLAGGDPGDGTATIDTMEKNGGKTKKRIRHMMLNDHHGHIQNIPINSPFTNGHVEDIGVVQSDGKLSPIGDGKYELRLSFESLPNGEHSYEYWCLDDKTLNDDTFRELEAKLKGAKEELLSAKKAKNDEAIKAAEEAIKATVEKINAIDPELRDAYGSSEQKTRFAGYKITRKDAAGHLTNLPTVASTVNIETRGLGRDHSIRLVLRSGETLQLGVDEQGNWNGTAVFLTKAGAKVPYKFTGEETDEFFNANAGFFGGKKKHELLYNRWQDIMNDLDGMGEINFNGVNILDRVRDIARSQAGLTHENDPLGKLRTGNSNSTGDETSEEEQPDVLDPSKPKPRARAEFGNPSMTSKLKSRVELGGTKAQQVKHENEESRVGVSVIL